MSTDAFCGCRNFRWLVSLSLVICCLVAVSLRPSIAGAQPVQSVESGQDSKSELERLRERIEKLEQEVQRMRQPAAGDGNQPAAADESSLFVAVETPFIGMFHRPSGRTRFLGLRLLFVNRSNAERTVTREGISLLVDGKPTAPDTVPDDMQNYAYRIGTTTYRLRDLELLSELRLPPNGIGSGWLFLKDLGDRPEVPKIVVRLSQEDWSLDVDVNAQRKLALGMEVERIGPRESLALIRINGTLDTINVQSLADEFDALARDNLFRVVIEWGESATSPDPQLYNWLVQSAMQVGRGVQVSQYFPTLNAGITELHLAKMPDENSPRYRSMPGEDRLHDDPASAVRAALRTAFKMLPRDELVAEIRNGHPLSRVAALEIGAGRLTEEQLPLVLELTADNDPRIQQAALSALRHFGEPAAVETLVEHVKKNSETLSPIAIDALAGSRYGAAHRALAELIQQEPAKTRRSIMGVLAQHPRPIWSDLIYEYAESDPENVDPETLKALIQVGHAELIDVLSVAIQSKNEDVSKVAFEELARRADSRSESIALEFALERLKSQPPDTVTRALLTRTRDQRAVPLLVEHLKGSNPSEIVIDLLGQLGDRDVIPELEKAFDRVPDRSKSHVLTALRRLAAESFYEYSGKALLGRDSSLISSATQNLQQDGSRKAIELLAEALQKSDQSMAWSYICNALSNLGTPEAVAALTKARDGGDRVKQNYAATALRNIRQRSPGYQYVYRGQSASSQENWDEAIKMYSLAIKIDPELPDAYAGRGNSLLKQDKVDEARADFERAIELDPFNSVALTSLSICDAMQGKVDAAIDRVEQNRERFKDDALFAYNAACVYGQSILWLKQQDTDDKQHQARLERFTAKGLEDLQHSVKRGFRDFDWMQKDPDLVPFQGMDEFKALIPGQEAEKSEEAE